MKNFLNDINEIPHPEEARSAASKDAECSCSLPFANSFTGSQARLARLEARTTAMQRLFSRT
jgi:hypothetical protein